MIDQLEIKCQALCKTEQKTYERNRLVVYALIIIGTQICSALLFQKIYKVPYTRSNSMPGIDGQMPSDLFQNPFGVSLFHTIFGIILGYCTTPNDQNLTSVPRLEILKFSFLSFVGLILLIVCMIQTSYITVTIINNCQLIIIVLMAVFLSNSSPRFKVHKRQIVIAIFLCLGIGLYSFFDNKDEKGPNKPVTWISGIMMLIMLLAGGYRPEVLAQIRDKYSPSPSYVYYSSCCYTAAMIIIVSAFTSDLWKLVKFIWQHDRLLLDLSIESLFYGGSQLFIYRGGLQYKQHIMPTITVVAKLFTLIFNSILFHHNLNVYQYMSIALVFGPVIIDMYLNYYCQQNQPNQEHEIKQEIQQTGNLQFEVKNKMIVQQAKQ